jgi:hypothetical protein
MSVLDGLAACAGAWRGTFAAPLGPDWGWRIEITPENGQSIRIAHCNIDPDAKEEPAVEGVYSRV